MLCTTMAGASGWRSSTRRKRGPGHAGPVAAAVLSTSASGCGTGWSHHPLRQLSRVAAPPRRSARVVPSALGRSGAALRGRAGDERATINIELALLGKAFTLAVRARRLRAKPYLPSSRLTLAACARGSSRVRKSKRWPPSCRPTSRTPSASFSSSRGAWAKSTRSNGVTTIAATA